MTKRTRTLYQQCLKRINHRCQEFYGRTPQPTTVKSDLGVAVVEALVACYPTATPRGCYFHLRNVSVHLLFFEAISFSCSLSAKKCLFYNARVFYLRVEGEQKMTFLCHPSFLPPFMLLAFFSFCLLLYHHHPCLNYTVLYSV